MVFTRSLSHGENDGDNVTSCMSSLDDILNWESAPVFEPDLSTPNSVSDSSENCFETNCATVTGAESGNAPGNVSGNAADYAVASQIFFGDGLYEVRETNVNGTNQIALVLVEDEVTTDGPISELQSLQTTAVPQTAYPESEF